MRFGSLFSGIGGIDLGLERSGMECAWQVEIDPYRRAVLARHWPNVRRYEDVRGVQAAGRLRLESVQGDRTNSRKRSRKSPRGQGDNALDPVDLVCGGFPCQDVSTAGKRAGLRAPRSGLFFEFARIVGELRPRWFLVENVPGLYSSNAGKDFDTVIGTLAELGYGLAWRVLDSQYFGVPQRRRRVFIVGYLGGPCPPAVLFEREGSEGDSAEGGKAGEGVTGPLIGGSGSGGIRRAASGQADEASYYIPEVGYALPASGRGSGDQHGNWWNTTYVCEENTRDEMRIRGSHPHVSARWGGKQKPWVVNPLEAADGHHGRSSPRGDGADNLVVADPLTASYRKHGGASAGKDSKARNVICAPANPDGVRETTELPRRLDSRRYAALGDAVTVNVADWIGKRIMAVERCTS